MRQAGYPPTHRYTLGHSDATQLTLKGNDDLALAQEALRHRDLRDPHLHDGEGESPVGGGGQQGVGMRSAWQTRVATPKCINKINVSFLTHR